MRPEGGAPTIRERIVRRVRWLTATAFGGWLYTAIAMTAFGPPGRGDSPLEALRFLGIAVFMGAILALVFTVRCPRCRARLGQFAPSIAFQWGRRGRINFCPYCGVHLDDPAP